jgi:TPR repeat protein
MDLDNVTMEQAVEAFEADDHALSFALFEQLVKSTRDPEAMFFLGRHYVDGLGTIKDEDKALDIWKRAGKKGSVDAQYALLERVQTTSQCCKA